jgi:hypothetical protein
MSRRKRFNEMSLAELEALETSERYAKGRSDAFYHGNPDTVLEYWEREEPTDTELRVIIKNILYRMGG